MQYLSELIPHNPQQHHTSHTFQTAACRARACPYEHAEGQNHPCDVRPQSGVVAEEACRCDERRDLEEAASQRVLHIIAVVHHQFTGDEERERRDENEVKPELGVHEQLPEPQFRHCEIEQGEVCSRQETEQDGTVFYSRTLKVGYAGVVCGESARACCRHGIVYGVKPVHAEEHIAQRACQCENDVNASYPFRVRGYLRVQFHLDGSCRLRRENLHRASDERRQQCDGEEHDAQTAYPVSERPPEEYGVRQTFHVVYYRSAGGGESRHCLEVCVGEALYVSSRDERQCTEKAEEHPCQRHHQIGVATREHVAAVASHVSQHSPARRGYCHGIEEGIHVVLSVCHSHYEAYRHERSLDEKE